MREMHQLIPYSLFWENPYAGHGLIVENSACALKLADMFFNNTSNAEIEAFANSKDCQNIPSAKFSDTRRLLKRMTLSEQPYPTY